MRLALEVTSFQKALMGEAGRHVFDGRGGSIGRARRNEWVLPDPDRFVSGNHAMISAEGGRFYVTDTSTNGVFVNESSIPLGRGARWPISDGDRLALGDFHLVARLIDEAPDNAPKAWPGTAPAAASLADGGGTAGSDAGSMVDIDALLGDDGDDPLPAAQPVGPPRDQARDQVRDQGRAEPAGPTPPAPADAVEPRPAAPVVPGLVGVPASSAAPRPDGNPSGRVPGREASSAPMPPTAPPRYLDDDPAPVPPGVGAVLDNGETAAFDQDDAWGELLSPTATPEPPDEHPLPRTHRPGPDRTQTRGLETHWPEPHQPEAQQPEPPLPKPPLHEPALPEPPLAEPDQADAPLPPAFAPEPEADDAFDPSAFDGPPAADREIADDGGQSGESDNLDTLQAIANLDLDDLLGPMPETDAATPGAAEPAAQPETIATAEPDARLPEAWPPADPSPEMPLAEGSVDEPSDAGTSDKAALPPVPEDLDNLLADIAPPQAEPPVPEPAPTIETGLDDAGPEDPLAALSPDAIARAVPRQPGESDLSYRARLWDAFGQVYFRVSGANPGGSPETGGTT